MENVVADVTEVLNKTANQEERKAVLPLDVKSGIDAFQQISTELRQQDDKDEIKEYKKQITQAREEANKKQAELRVKYDFKAPEFVAHATHVSQEEFKSSVGELFAKYPENTDLVPAFSKGTQNEFNAERSVKSRFEDDKLMALGQLMPYPERVFAIATKQDDQGNPILDEQGRPVPQDGSYAYSLKKCCASINMIDDETPLLIGFEGKYADFESGKKTGHIYIGKGETFKAEYDEHGNITEYTSDKEMVVTHEYKTTPKDAMEHNVQLVMFNTEDGYDKWAAEVKNKRDKFATFISSDDIMIKLLQEEIAAGRATYINATKRGFNPKIEALQTAQENKIRITEPSPEHYQAFLTACQKMQDYTNSSDTPNDVSKEVSKGFIFAKKEYLSLSEEEFKTKIVDEYAQRSQDGAKKPEHLRFIMVGDEIAGYINVRALPRDKFDERQGLESCKKWDHISENGARAAISDVLLPEYRGKDIIGKATKLFFNELQEKGINEVSATVLKDNSSSNSAHEKMIDNYGGKAYEVYGDPNGKGVQYYNRYIISTDTSGRQKDNYKEKMTDAWNIAFDEKTGEFVEVNDKTGEHRAFQQEQKFKPETERPSKAPEMKFNPASMEFEYANPKFQELTERRRELNRTKQDILALKERIAKQGLKEIGLEGKMGQTGNSRAPNPNEVVTETHKKVAESQIEDLKPFIKNYIEQLRSK